MIIQTKWREAARIIMKKVIGIENFYDLYESFR